MTREATFDDFLLLATKRLQSALNALPLRQLSASERTLVIRRLQPVLGQVERYLRDYAAGGRYAAPGHAGDVLARTSAQALDALQHIHDPLRRACQQTLPPDAGPRRPAGASNGVEATLDRLGDAERLLAVGRDLLHTHHTGIGAATTPYAAVLASSGGQLYVMSQMGQLAEQAHLITRALARRANDNHDTPLWLDAAARRMEQAAAGLRTATTGAPGSLAALPAAPHLTPIPAQPGEDPRTALRRIAEGADQLQTTMFQAARRPGFQPAVTGAAMRHSADTLALSHLLTGNLLRAVGQDLLGEQRRLLDQAGTELRTAARAWAEVGARWGRVVDLGDPHGTGPGRHPAAIEAEALAARTGRLLFSDDWTPASRGAVPRGGEQILGAVGGPEPLLQTARRLPAAAVVVAEETPELLQRIAGRLVTDDGLVDPRRDGGPRWFPAQPSQVAALVAAYGAAASASASADAAVTSLAASAAVPTARAQLDVAARRQQPPAQAEAPRTAIRQQQPGVGYQLG